MARLEVKRQMGRGDIAAVSELLEVATVTDGHPPLGEHHWLDLVHGGREGFAGLVAWEPGHDHPVGYAQLSREEPVPGAAGVEAAEAGWALEYVVDPHHRQTDPGIGNTLVGAALDIVRAEGGGRLSLWVPHPTRAHDSLATAMGLQRGRELRQLRRSLPVTDPWDLHLRPFVPGRDEQAWLEVNNRAFADHPEQGRWTERTLLTRQAQPWFDPAGLLLHEREDRLAGFCWTKVHPDHRPPLGEIYVVAVDPDFRRLGLGRRLVLAGLDRLHRLGLTTAMLYVDAHNEPALRLYRELGFTVDHVDRAYYGHIASRPASEPRPHTEATPTAEPTT